MGGVDWSRREKEGAIKIRLLDILAMVFLRGKGRKRGQKVEDKKGG